MSHCTKFVPVVLLLGFTFFYACRSKDAAPELSQLPPDHIALQAGNSVQTSAGLTLTADSVRVFICPANADCFAPNSAGIVLRVLKSTQSRLIRLFAWIPNYDRRLAQSSGLTDSTAVELGGQRYKVILRDGRYVDATGSENRSEAIIQVSAID